MFVRFKNVLNPLRLENLLVGLGVDGVEELLALVLLPHAKRRLLIACLVDAGLTLVLALELADVVMKVGRLV